ncbi:pilus assembly protein N-terminal domain-containing protein [Halodurantibacterium flavum]|uniref:Pilus assembly protein N-terminal domain-containing protein n=1 Tax=Halodurantibacterium flavum TaxID=1382802 RepID=A0ABW4S8X8_9RHOB
MKHALAALFCVVAIPALAQGAGRGMEVGLDMAQVMRVEDPLGTIVIGNAGLLDATILDDQTLILTGRAPGVTNLILLSPEGEVLSERMVRVSGGGAGLTTVHRGRSRETYACGARCTPVFSVGDEAGFASTVAGQIGTGQQIGAAPPR